MDIIAPLAKTGAISETLNLWLAVPTGFVFGFGLYHAGFTDSRKVAFVFYLKDVSVPLVMFSAIVTGMLGLWLLSLLGVLDTSKIYFLPTYLMPMAVGGLLFGSGMALGGFCAGTAAASVATGRIDALVFIVGFLIGTLLFGDLFPVLGDFYYSDYLGVYRLDQLLHIDLGPVVLLVVVAAVAGSLLLRFGQRHFWPTPRDETREPGQVMKYEVPLVLLALLIGFVLAFFPTSDFLRQAGEPEYYIVPRSQSAEAPARHGQRHGGPASGRPAQVQPQGPALSGGTEEGC